MSNGFPKMMALRQSFPATPPVDIRATLQHQFESQQLLSRIKPGARIAVAVGSRGITHIQTIVAEVIRVLKAAKANPFIVPAMGSHGGATPEGQAEILAEYGVSEEKLGVPVRAAMEVEAIGKTDDGVTVHCSTEALRADGIIVINRIKPHTDFSGGLGSGIMKMMVIGLGKRIGAANFHGAASRMGYEHTIRSIARVVLKTAPILGGVAAVENQFHETARIAVLKREEVEQRENELFLESARLMPKLPFDDIDLLIVDRIGKNISGAGMDPNIIGRGVHGYSSMIGSGKQNGPTVRRLFVRDLTPQTHGNAIGIGFADLTTGRLVRAMDKHATYINALTSLTPHSAKIPIHFDTDHEAVTQSLASLALDDSASAKVIRIADTLSLERIEVSEAYRDRIASEQSLEARSEPKEMQFDAAGNLAPLSGS
jgi:hypothetical protein